MKYFEFESYTLKNNRAEFCYNFDKKHKFKEIVEFELGANYIANPKILDSAMFLAFILIGTSYFKCFPESSIVLNCKINNWQSDFFNNVYKYGLSQFAFENNLNNLTSDIFKPTARNQPSAIKFEGRGALCLESGGKDSLLLSTILADKNISFDGLYITSNSGVPKVIRSLPKQNNLIVINRKIDIAGLEKVKKLGSLNGHVPVTYINSSLAIIQALLIGKDDILLAIGQEGEEPHAFINNMPVYHQWSKTYTAEIALADYVKQYISSDLNIGSPLRSYSELYVAELFCKKAWAKYAKYFSSCNESNYKQTSDSNNLTWCGNCPKCANAYLMFAPFIASKKLQKIFAGKDLFSEPKLTEIFKGLLGVGNNIKPFECVGGINELQKAYYMAIENGYNKLPFDVNNSNFDYKKTYEMQTWCKDYII